MFKDSYAAMRQRRHANSSTVNISHNIDSGKLYTELTNVASDK